jgi:DNA polymerase-1
MDPMGTVHSRASHFSPNMGQVPASKSPYGEECRSAFGPNGMKTGGRRGDCSSRSRHERPPASRARPSAAPARRRGLQRDRHQRRRSLVHTQAMGLVGPDEPRDKHSELHNILREKGAKTFGYSYLFGCFPPKSGRVFATASHGEATRTRNGATCSTSSSSALTARALYSAPTRKWARGSQELRRALKLGKLHAKLKGA